MLLEVWKWGMCILLSIASIAIGVLALCGITMLYEIVVDRQKARRKRRLNRNNISPAIAKQREEFWSNIGVIAFIACFVLGIAVSWYRGIFLN